MAILVPYMRGWRGYFGFCETPDVLIQLTRWVRVRLQVALWRQWNPTPPTGNADSIGGTGQAGSSHCWQCSRPLASGPFESSACCALECLFPRSRSSFVVRAVLAQNSRTAVYGPVRTVVWQGSAGDRRPYADQTPKGRAIRCHRIHKRLARRTTPLIAHCPRFALKLSEE